MKERIPFRWMGIDVGKGHYWFCLIDKERTTVWSARVVNDEAAILDAVGGVLARAEEVVWGVDVTGTMSGLSLALLAAHGQRVRYVPGRVVNKMAGAYPGEAKTDARDACVIAETVRQRGDLIEVAATLVTELRLLVTHRTDLVGDRVRMVNRLPDVLSGCFPALERSFDDAHSRGALVLLTGDRPRSRSDRQVSHGCGHDWSSGRSAAPTRSQEPRWSRPRPRRPSCPDRRSRPAS
ncbi:MAG: IS110 family transposase [Propionibacteriaceae bacterium]